MSKILVVDDDQDIVYMVKAVLEKNGYEVATAADGQQALKAIKNSIPDLMIVDLTMPEMDGWRLSMNVRQDEKCKNMPIIVLSGLIAEEESKPEFNEPYNVLMSKPFDILKLANKVKELLALSSETK
jgi:CheY-like chemotaxis protein